MIRRTVEMDRTVAARIRRRTTVPRCCPRFWNKLVFCTKPTQRFVAVYTTIKVSIRSAGRKITRLYSTLWSTSYRSCTQLQMNRIFFQVFLCINIWTYVFVELLVLRQRVLYNWLVIFIDGKMYLFYFVYSPPHPPLLVPHIHLFMCACEVDIEALKHAPSWGGMRHRRDSISGLSTHSQPLGGYAFGTHSPAPTFHSGKTFVR